MVKMESFFMFISELEKTDLRIVRAAMFGRCFQVHSYSCSNRCAAAISQYPSDL